MNLADRSRATLANVLSSKAGGTMRPGQEAMVAAVAGALEERHHLLVEAGTGTGKSLAYLIPALESGHRIVVATATKTLQDQLADSELPFLADQLERRITWAVVKGRQSYACMAKLVERFGEDLDRPLDLGLFPDGDVEAEQAVATWARRHPSGDRDDLDEAVDDRVWRALSVSGIECPGAANCPQGGRCFAEAALQRAAGADVIITNHHLYGLHVASGRRLLPDHHAVVFDEAHKLEGALSSVFAVDIGPGRLVAFANNAARWIDPAVRRGGSDPIEAVRRAATGMAEVFAGLPPTRLDPTDGEVGTVILRGSQAVSAAVKALRTAEEGDPDAGSVARAKTQGGHVVDDFDTALRLPEGHVAWFEADRAVVRVAPIEVADALGGSLLVHQPVVLTSATLSVGGSFAPVARSLGFREEGGNDTLADLVEDPLPRTYAHLRIAGGFDYARQALLYVASHLPEPSDPRWADAATDEIETLTTASGGRALLLATSFAMVKRIADRLAAVSFRVLVQGDLPKKRLIAEFVEDETATLVATMGYWEGIDVPGRSLSLVVIDKLPFARPDDPLQQARREAVEARGGSSFGEVDLPRAAILLAQGAGRLIRNETDQGLVAVLDPRLATRRYGRRILLSLPTMPRTGAQARAIRFLRDLG